MGLWGTTGELTSIKWNIRQSLIVLHIRFTFNHFENVLKFRKGFKKNNHLLESSAKGVGASTPASIKKIDFSSQGEKIDVQNAL